MKKVAIGIAIGIVITSSLFFIDRSQPENSDNDVTVVETITGLSILESPFNVYEINTKCQLYYRFFDKTHQFNDYQDKMQAFIGFDESDVGTIIAESLHTKEIEDLPTVLKQEEAAKNAINWYTKRTIQTNSINPNLTEDTREFIVYLTEGKFFSFLTYDDLEKDPICKNDLEKYFPTLAAAIKLGIYDEPFP